MYILSLLVFVVVAFGGAAAYVLFSLRLTLNTLNTLNPSIPCCDACSENDNSFYFVLCFSVR